MPGDDGRCGSHATLLGNFLVIFSLATENTSFGPSKATCSCLEWKSTHFREILDGEMLFHLAMHFSEVIFLEVEVLTTGMFTDPWTVDFYGINVYLYLDSWGKNAFQCWLAHIFQMDLFNQQLKIQLIQVTSIFSNGINKHQMMLTFSGCFF